MVSTTPPCLPVWPQDTSFPTVWMQGIRNTSLSHLLSQMCCQRLGEPCPLVTQPNSDSSLKHGLRFCFGKEGSYRNWCRPIALQKQGGKQPTLTSLRWCLTSTACPAPLSCQDFVTKCQGKLLKSQAVNNKSWSTGWLMKKVFNSYSLQAIWLKVTALNNFGNK